MSDSPSVSVETSIAGGADRIYALVSDLDVMGSFNTEFQGGEWIGGRPATVGASFRGRQKLGEREWETTSTVVTAEPGSCFAWKVGSVGEPVATWTLRLSPTSSGTDVSYSFVHGPAESGLTAAVAASPDRETEIIEGRLAHLQENMIRTLEGIRRRLAA